MDDGNDWLTQEINSLEVRMAMDSGMGRPLTRKEKDEDWERY